MCPVANYAFNVLMALDRLANALRGGDGRLTMSGAAWRGECAGVPGSHVARVCIDWLALHLFHQVNHCESSDAYDCALVATQVGAALRALPQTS